MVVNGGSGEVLADQSGFIADAHAASPILSLALFTEIVPAYPLRSFGIIEMLPLRYSTAYLIWSIRSNPYPVRAADKMSCSSIRAFSYP